MDEQILIGNQNRMIIRDGVVDRPSHPWSDGIRRLLQFCRTDGLKVVPEWRGQDEQGNEIFELYLRDILVLTTLHEAV